MRRSGPRIVVDRYASRARAPLLSGFGVLSGQRHGQGLVTEAFRRGPRAALKAYALAFGKRRPVGLQERCKRGGEVINEVHIDANA